MKFEFNNKEFKELIKLLEGGEMPAPEEAAAPAPEQAGGSPEELIIQAAMQAVQTQDAQLALLVCQALVEMAGGGAQPAPAAPEGQAPVYRKGGKLAGWVLK